MTADRPPTPGMLADRWATPLLALATFATSLGNLALGPFLPAIARDFGTSVAVVGQAPALAALAAAGLGLVAGPLADRLGHCRALRFGLVSLAAGAAGVALAPGLALLLPAALLGVVGQAATPPAAEALAGRWSAGEARRRAMAWLKGGTSVALVAGVPLLAAVAGLHGWRAAFAALALLAVGAALAAGALAPDSPADGAGRGVGTPLPRYRPILRHRPTRGLLVANLGCTAGAFTLLTYLGAFLAERHGLATREIGWAYLAVGGGACLGSAAAGSRLGARPLRPLLVGANLAAGALVASLLALALPLPAVALLLTLALACVATCGVASSTLLVGETPGGRATTMALGGAAGSLGIALGGALGGLLLATLGYGALGLVALAWYAAAAVLVLRSAPRQAPGAASAAERLASVG